MSGVSAGGAGSGVAVRLGYFPTRHVGLVAGAAGEGGERFDDGCTKDTCGFVSYRVPVALQLVLDDRKQGPYLELGVSLMPSYLLYDPSGTASARGPADGHAALGWRWRSGAAVASRSVSRVGFEAFVSADGGVFTQVGAKAGEGDASGSVPAAARAFHGTFSIGCGWHFTL